MGIDIVEPKLFAGAVADEIVALLSEAVSERGSASLVLAGGSTPAAVYRMLSIPPRVESVPWGSLRVYLGDERWVPHDDPLSNYRMARETLLSKLEHEANTKGKPKMFPVDTSLKSPELGARQYEALIREHERLGPQETPRFDVVLLGMGDDGHTASLFPGSPLVQEGAVSSSSALVAVAEHPIEKGKPGGTRVTLTVPVLTAARRLLFLVTGDAKAEMARRVLESDATVSELPACLWKNAQGSVSWFVDSAAARLLTSVQSNASVA